MTDETETEGAPETDEERPGVGAESRRLTTLAKLAAAVVVALPGAYAAVRTQSAADSGRLRTEVVVRDRQEEATRRHVEALRREIAAVREAAVTHRELLDLVLKMRARRRAYRPRSSSRATEVSERERALERKLTALRARDKRASEAKAAARAVRRGLPRLRPAAAVRKSVEQKL